MQDDTEERQSTVDNIDSMISMKDDTEERQSTVKNIDSMLSSHHHQKIENQHNR